MITNRFRRKIGEVHRMNQAVPRSEQWSAETIDVDEVGDDHKSVVLHQGADATQGGKRRLHVVEHVFQHDDIECISWQLDIFEAAGDDIRPKLTSSELGDEWAPFDPSHAPGGFHDPL